VISTSQRGEGEGKKIKQPDRVTLKTACFSTREPRQANALLGCRLSQHSRQIGTLHKGTLASLLLTGGHFLGQLVGLLLHLLDVSHHVERLYQISFRVQAFKQVSPHAGKG